jgi:hypothetical protein
MQTDPDDFMQSVQAKLQGEGIPGRVTALSGVPYQWTIDTTPVAQISFNTNQTVEVSFIAPPDRFVELWANEALQITPGAINNIAARIASWVLFVDESPRKPS